MKLDKSSFVPLYRQLIGIIYQRIHDGIYPLHTQLPSQKEIADEFDISLIVVRQAWREMSHENMIAAWRGSGTVVNKIPEDIHYYHSLHGLTHDSGQKVDHSLLSCCDSGENALVKKILLLDEDQSYIHLKRLRVIQNTPVSVENNFLNKNIVRDFDIRNYKTSSSLYAYLKDYAGITIHYAEESIKAIVCDKETAKILQLSAGYPLLLVTRKSYCQQGIFEYTQYIIKSEYFGVIKYSSSAID